MTVIDYVLGDRAGAFLLGSSLLVLTLASIAAIVDVPLRSLREARLAPPAQFRPPLSERAFLFIGLPASLLVFVSAAVQTYAASTPLRANEDGLVLFFTINAGFFLAVVIWGFASPLSRHWGLGLGVYGLALAAIFPLLALVLHLDFGSFGTVADASQRALFATVVGAILCSLGACLAAILSMLVYVANGSIELAAQHRMHSGRGAGPGGRTAPRRLETTRQSDQRRRGGRSVPSDFGDATAPANRPELQ